MGIRVSGIVSGIDTDAVVQGLSSAYQVKIDKQNKSKKKTQYQQDAWKTINDKLTSLYKGTLTKMKTYGSYKTKSAAAANKDSGIKATATSKAVNGTYKLKVNSTAAAAFITGAALSSQAYTATYSATNATTFAKMHKQNSNTTLSQSLNGQTLTFTADEREVKKNAEGAALYKLVDENGQDVAINTSISPSGATEMTQAQMNEYLTNLQASDPSIDTSRYKSMEVTLPTATKTFTYTFSDSSSIADINNELKNAGIKGLQASMSNGAIRFDNVAGYSKNADGSLYEAKGTYNISGSALVDLGFSSSSLNVNVSASQDAQGTYSYNNSASSTVTMQYDENDTKLTAKSNVSQYLGDVFKNNAQTDADGKRYITYDLVTGSGSNEKTKQVKIYEDQSMSDFASALQSASEGLVTASFDATNQRFFLTSSKTGAENDFTLRANGAGSQEALEQLGLLESSPLNTGKAKMSRQTATDAEVELNGAILTSKTNSIDASALGITLDVGAAKLNEETTIEVKNDSDTVYKMIKGFFKEYNSLLADMTGAYYAEKSDYEPLTEEEESAMTQTQVEKWEKEARKDVLRRDDRLNSIISTMRNALTGAVKITNEDGTTSRVSLASFGVSTGNWNEYGVMHIDGDEDDADYSSKTNKLQKALEDDPDKVMNTFGQIMTNLYDKMTTMSKRTTQRTYGNFYNDKTMKTQLENYDKEVKTLQDKLKEMQDKYYDQFSKMEVAMSKVNAVASQLGFNTLSGGQ